MQDMRGGSDGDRRLRQHSHHAAAALKCPRCDSLNTKFCYYNNYNLSQPRHFCKGCRRYWTKGGVLRNVPVGGGCRKTKRAKQKSGAAERGSNARSSSSESSTLTAATTTVTTPTSAVAMEQGSALNANPSSSAAASNLADSRFLNANPSYDYPVNRTTDSGQIFLAEIGSFANLTTSFGVGNIPTTTYGLEQKCSRGPGPENRSSRIVGNTVVEELKLQEITGEMGNGVGLSALDWGSGDGGGGRGDQDQELYDLTAAVDPAYWCQPQWTDGGDQSLNFLSQ